MNMQFFRGRICLCAGRETAKAQRGKRVLRRGDVRASDCSL